MGMRLPAEVLAAIDQAEAEGRATVRRAAKVDAKRAASRGTLSSIEVPVPPSTNHLFANIPGKGRIRTRAYKSWQELAYPFLSQVARPTRFPVAVLIVVSGNINPSRDIANVEKAVVDGLVHCGVLPDDSVRYVNDNRQLYVGGDGEAKAEVFIFERAS